MKISCPLLMRFSFLWFLFVLSVPPPAASEFSHTVQPGESLFSIAKKNHIAVFLLQEANGLRNEKIYPGQRLIYLPRPEEAPAKLEPGRKKSQDGEVAEGTEAAQAEGKGIGFLLDPKDQQLLVRVAKSFLGIKYILGGSSRNGMDCSAFVQKVFRISGIDLPRTAREQFQVGYRVAREALQVGDLVFFKRSRTPRPAHVGIYIGDGRFIHTSLRKQRVYIDSLNSRYFGAQFIGAKRIEEARRPTETEKSNYPSTSPAGEGSFDKPVCP